ncbi:MAG: hypothetical protein AB8G05_22720 [Oligoflexales bacterium]
MRHNYFFLILSSYYLVFISLNLGGCGTHAGNPGEEETPSPTPLPSYEEVILPDATSIQLGSLGVKQEGASLFLEENRELLLNETERCQGSDQLGVFGFALGPVCHTSYFIDDTLYGRSPDRDGDGDLSCADYNLDKNDLGILFPLLCEPGLLANPKIKTLNILEGSENFAISFLPFIEDEFAVGSWTAIGEDSGRYPGQIRIWSNQNRADLAGILGMKLNSKKSGQLFFDYRPLNSELLGSIEYETQFNTEVCETKPSRENCHWQESMFAGTKGSSSEAPIPGMHLIVLANKKENPSFLVLEGKLSYTQEAAEKTWPESNAAAHQDFHTVREVYFRTVQKGSQIWGSFDFKNSDNLTIESIIDVSGFPIDLTKMMRNGSSDIPYQGICQNLGSDEWVDCVDINYQDYNSLWLEDANVSAIGPNFELSIDFGAPPEKVGITKD